VPEKQAEVMAETFVYNMESLVTTDYLDARFAEQDARFDARISKYLTEQSKTFEKRFTAMDIKFTELKGELKGELSLQRWILAAIAASTVLPALNSLFSLA